MRWFFASSEKFVFFNETRWIGTQLSTDSAFPLFLG
jgi:hypothetical protein